MYHTKPLKIFTWSGERNAGVVSNIKIYHDDVLFGEISEWSRHAVATINGQQFAIERAGLGFIVYIIDPADNKAHCEMVFSGLNQRLLISAPAFKYEYRKYEIWSCEKKMLVEMIPDRMWFSKSGSI